MRKLLPSFSLVLLFALFLWGQLILEFPLMLITSLSRLAEMLVISAVIAVLAWISGGIGRKLTAPLPLHTLTPYERISLNSALGLGVIALIALGMGLIGQFNALIWGVVLACGAVTRSESKAWARDVRYSIRRITTPLIPFERFVFFVGLFWGIGALLIAFAPPFRWDALAYHLVAPQRYLQDGAILAHPDNHFMGFPQLLEMLFGVGMMLTTDRFGAVLQAYFGALGLLAGVGFLRRWADKETSLWFLLILASSYGVWALFGVPYVDLALFCYGALALIVLSEWHSSRQSNWLFYAGMVGGFALSVKYTGGVLGGAMIAFVVITDWRNAPAHLARLAVGAFSVFVLWAIKGVLLYQNPLYPYGIGGIGWDSFRNQAFNGFGEGLLSGENAWHLLALPFTASIFGVERAEPYSFSVGFWLLIAPFLLLGVWRTLPPRTQQLARHSLILVVVFAGVWGGLSAISRIGAQPRLQMSAFVPVAILGAIALRHTLHLTRVTVRVLLGLSLGILAINIVYDIAGLKTIGYYVGLTSADEYLENVRGTHYHAMQALQTVQAGSHVLFLWEALSYYCPPTVTCDADVVLDHWVNARQNGLSPTAIFEQWRTEGITHLLIHGERIGVNVGMDFWHTQFEQDRPYIDEFRAILPAQMRLIWTDNKNVHALYTWKDDQ